MREEEYSYQDAAHNLHHSRLAPTGGVRLGTFKGIKDLREASPQTIKLGACVGHLANLQ